MSLDVAALRAQFPILSKTVDGKLLVYLDNAATTQKPQAVIDALVDFYTGTNANVHRGAHHLSDEATRRYENARTSVAKFINAKAREEVIWTSGTTEAINIVANGLGQLLSEGDEVMVTELEHHANLVTWQQACRRSGATLNVVPIFDSGELDVDAFDRLLSENTKLVAFPHVSNALGTVNPIKLLTEKAKAVGAWVLVDGAQACGHLKPNLKKLDVDFYTVSAHKLCGPTGIGMLYGKEKWLNKLPPYQGGGEMIEEVTFEKTTYADLPHKFEAGTPNICGGIAFGAALDYMNAIGFEAIGSYEDELLQYANEQLTQIEGLRIYGDNKQKTAVISFNIDSIHPYDVGTLLDKMGIAVRTGHHCAQPIMDYYKIPGTIRASFAFYNTKDDVDTFVNGVQRAVAMLR